MNDTEKELARVRDMLTFERKRADHWAQRCRRIEAAAKALLKSAAWMSDVVLEPIADDLIALEDALKPEEMGKKEGSE